MSPNIKSILLALLSSLLLWLAWPPHSLGWISYIGFVPLLLVSDQYKHNLIGTWTYRSLIYISLLFWNILTTWWIWEASPGGSIAAIVLNTLMMSIVWWTYGGIYKRNSNAIGNLFLVSFWLAYELFHLNWDGTWPWLVLGNVFANNTSMIQWYEYTGHLGGSVWVLVMNVLVFQSWQAYQNKTSLKKPITITLTVLLLPILWSVAIVFFQSRDSKEHHELNNSTNPINNNTLVIQPNLDPYSEKFSNTGTALSPKMQLQRMLEMAEENISAATEFVILPETALQGAMRDSELPREAMIFLIKDFVARHPNCCVITGANTYTSYKNKATQSSRQLEPGGDYFDFFNTALKIDTSDNIEIYHKSRLVPGVEKLPYPIIFGPLVRLLDLEAQAGGLGVQEDASVFTHHGIKLAPLICYESVFGGYVRSFVNKDANALIVITNDGWWGNTDGYQQHLEYGKLRAIEFRRELVQCANTGLSAHINTLGEVTQITSWWKQEVLSTNIHHYSSTTLYARLGDYPGWLGVAFSVMIVGWLGYRKRGEKKMD